MNTAYLIAARAKYPYMQAQDYVKLLYQAQFGCEHIMGDYAMQYLQRELADCAPTPADLSEPICDEYCRVNLCEYKRLGYAPSALMRCMLAVRSSGSYDALRDELNNFVRLAHSGSLVCDNAESFVNDYIRAGMPPVHHSERFARLYQPHYRVIYRRHARLLQLVAAIEAATDGCNGSRPVFVALDGGCGSGKTFCANDLAALFDASVIRCDDFFLPPDMRTASRLAQAGGNIHYERLRQTLQQASSGADFDYCAYDCARNEFVPRRFKRSQVIIVEGSYALHSQLRHFYDVTALVSASEQVRMARLAQRNGGATEDFVNKWIPLEQKYFAQLDTNGCITVDCNEQL